MIDYFGPIVTLVTSLIGYGAIRAELHRMRETLERHERKHEAIEQRLRALEQKAA